MQPRGLARFITKSKREKIEKPVSSQDPIPSPEKINRDPGVGNSDIYFKFNQGYSNAVRQTILIKDL